MVKVVIYNNGKKVREEEGDAAAYSVITKTEDGMDVSAGYVGEGNPHMAAKALGSSAVKTNRQLSKGDVMKELEGMAIMHEDIERRMDEIFKQKEDPKPQKTMFTEVKR